MSSKLAIPEIETVPVAKQDLIMVWSLLVKVAGSLHRMGSYYSTPDKHTPLEPEREQEMLREVSAYFTKPLIMEMIHDRQLLDKYLTDEETEHLSEHVIQYWKPGQTPVAKN